MANESKTPIGSTRMANLVAESIRERIIDGDLTDGELLPKAELLRAEFGVGQPAMREAMRILESEQLVTVLRGNRGGARVRAPRESNTAYSLGLVLAAQNADAGEVRDAVSELEPIAAELCARADDRARAEIVRLLEEKHQACVEAFEASQPIDAELRNFHVCLAASCGNKAIALVLGALEALWTRHLASSAQEAGSRHGRSADVLRASISDHARLIELIRKGDAAGARKAATEHAAKLQASPHGTIQRRSKIDAATLKAILAS